MSMLHSSMLDLAPSTLKRSSVILLQMEAGPFKVRTRSKDVRLSFLYHIRSSTYASRVQFPLSIYPAPHESPSLVTSSSEYCRGNTFASSPRLLVSTTHLARTHILPNQSFRRTRVRILQYHCENSVYAHISPHRYVSPRLAGEGRQQA